MKDEAMLALAKEFAKNLKTEADLNNFSKALKKLTVETALNAELTEHLGYEKNKNDRWYGNGLILGIGSSYFHSFENICVLNYLR